jgi:arylsulfatase A-like enzyme
LVVIHARGGHPPWDVAREELKEMQPLGYAGAIEPRHAGEILMRIRSMRDTRFTDSDRVRMWALYALSVRAHDAALGRLVANLRSLKREENTTMFITSDMSPDATVKVPFGESEAPTEQALHAMLVIKPPPGNQQEATRSGFQASHVDLSTTILASLGLAPPTNFTGVDLWPATQANHADSRLPRLRYARGYENFAASWGQLLLQGHGHSASRFCDLSLEPACTTDVRELYPLAFSRMVAAIEERESQKRAPREPASLDAAALNALRLWGRSDRK